MSWQNEYGPYPLGTGIKNECKKILTFFGKYRQENPGIDSGATY